MLDDNGVQQITGVGAIGLHELFDAIALLYPANVDAALMRRVTPDGRSSRCAS